MDISAMNMFLSEDNIKRHLEHYRTQKLRLSIIEKSFPLLKGRTIGVIWRLSIDRTARAEAIWLKWYIESHGCFFDSFSISLQKSKIISKAYSSCEKFLYEIYLEAMKREYGFLYVYLDKGAPKIIFEAEPNIAFLKVKPILCFDLYEHTYFSDYIFGKEKFIRSALTYLNTGKLK